MLRWPDDRLIDFTKTGKNGPWTTTFVYHWLPWSNETSRTWEWVADREILLIMLSSVTLTREQTGKTPSRGGVGFFSAGQRKLPGGAQRKCAFKSGSLYPSSRPIASCATVVRCFIDFLTHVFLVRNSSLRGITIAPAVVRPTNHRVWQTPRKEIGENTVMEAAFDIL